MIIYSHKMQQIASKMGFTNFLHFAAALEHARTKVLMFQRELPLCLELVTHAIDCCRHQLSETTTENRQSECSEQTSTEMGPVLEEFIPINPNGGSDFELQQSREVQTEKINDSERGNLNLAPSDWLRSAQLWNQTSDPPPPPPPTLNLDSPEKTAVVQKNGGAFRPFQKEKTGGEGGGTSSSSAPASTAATSSTAETGSGGNNRREEKEAQNERKQRRCWSPELHRRFLHALQQLGGAHVATPKQIRELMKVDSLTNDEVKSHLQIAKVLLHSFQKQPHRVLEQHFISLLRSCKTATLLRKVQAQIITHGFQHNEYVAPNVVSAWAGLNRIAYARQVFDHFPDPNVALWNATFKGYVQNESFREVVFLFGKMKTMDVRPNCFTFPLVLKSCAKISAFVEGEEIHCEVIKSGFKGNQFVATLLIDVYSGVGAIGSAYKVFVEMLQRNIVAWTSMISGYILCNDLAFARRLFDLAPERDVVLWNIMVSGYIEIGDMKAARKLFDTMPNRDVMSWNTMLNGYANNGDVEACEQLFEEMPEQNVFSWNGLIGGYAHNGRFFEVLSCFKRMLIDGRVVPNDATLVTVLSACARLGALDLGKWVHVYAATIGFKRNTYVGNALIDMYSKCGVIENAMEVFGGMDSKDLITWNSMICGLATHGCGADALNLFHQMRNTGEKPDGITFIGVLCSCIHLGLVEEGISYFNSMLHDYSIVPQIEHYGCMVDLFGRAGLLDRAIEFVKRMPMEADAVIWAALLGACRTYKNIDLAELALQKLIQLEPKNPANYVMISNIYGDLGRWKDVARLKILVRDSGFKKLPGCSLIEVNDSVVEFYSLDERHSQSKEIYGVLKGLMKLLKSFGYEPNIMELQQGS